MPTKDSCKSSPPTLQIHSGSTVNQLNMSTCFLDSKPALLMIFAQVRLCDLCLLALAFRWPLLQLHWGASSELAATCDRSKEGREQPEKLCQGLCQGLRGDEIASCAQYIQRRKHESDEPFGTCDCFPYPRCQDHRTCNEYNHFKLVLTSIAHALHLANLG